MQFQSFVDGDTLSRESRGTLQISFWSTLAVQQILDLEKFWSSFTPTSIMIWCLIITKLGINQNESSKFEKSLIRPLGIHGSKDFIHNRFIKSKKQQVLLMLMKAI